MRKQLKKPAVLLLLTAILTVTAFGQPNRANGDRNRGSMDMMDKLNLTVEQEKQMKDLRFKHETVMIDLRADLQTERLKKRQLASADVPNKKKIYAQIEKAGAAEIKMEKARADHRLAVRAILDDEQFKIFRRGFMNKHHGFSGDRDDFRGKGDKSPRHNRF
mgnify:CR=1 FL=1|jgi:Spy/CpxP family protein refolding chaperone